VKAAFEVRKADRDGFDALLVGEVLETLCLDPVDRCAIEALLLRLQITVLELVIGDFQEISQRRSHAHSRDRGDGK